ncbi:MAG: peptidoglycan recognition family protein [Planctomycetota bacterium]
MSNAARTSATSSSRGIQRSHIVWASLMLAMAGVGGLLLLSEHERQLGVLPAAVQTEASTITISDALSSSAPLATERWSGIVIHHSGAVSGSPQGLAQEHEELGLRGLGYHFVLCNGRGAPDGEIHVGYRWDQQLPGAHAVGPNADFYNARAIGICLIGDGERRAFTEAQMVRLTELVSAIQERTGIPDADVRLHRDIASTPSPGRLFPEAAFKARLAASRAR